LDHLKGTGIPLCADEHCFGRTVDDYRFRISDILVSSCQCKIYMDTMLKELNPNEPSPIFLKDTRFLSILDLTLSIIAIFFFNITSCNCAAQMANTSIGKGLENLQLQPSLLMGTLYHFHMFPMTVCVH